jgi:hypothetical protein
LVKSGEIAPGPRNRIGGLVIRRIALLFILGSLLPVVCRAQSDPATVPPATNQQSSQSASGQGSPAAGKPEKAKKVWTNEEVSTLPGAVSVVGSDRPADRQTPISESGAGGADLTHRGKVQRYRAAEAELRRKIDAADQKISQLKNFKGNDSSPNGGINPNRGYGMTPVDEQVKQLEAKKKQLLASIEDLEIQARKEGIEPGELR